LAGLTVTVVVAVNVPAPFDAVSVNVNVCGRLVAGTIGAVKVAVRAVAVPPCVSVMPAAVVDHAEVIAPSVGTFGSETVPEIVTGEPEPTVCAAPGVRTSAVAGLIVTLTVELALPAMFVDVSWNVSVNGALPFGTVGAVNVAVGAVAVPPCVSATTG
jgi:hypothetical protein